MSVLLLRCMHHMALSVCLLTAALNACAQVQQSETLDDFEDIGSWRADASDQVSASLRRAPGARGQSLCLDYNFNGVAGYAVAKRELPLSFAGRFRLDAQMRGSGPVNHVELKFVDASGENVWWAQRRHWSPTADWEGWRMQQRHIEFAWGPSTDRSLKQTASLEWVISSDQGGQGSLCVDELIRTALPPEPDTVPTPIVTAAGQGSAHWQVDLGMMREFGALTLVWQPGHASSRYTLELSEDGVAWRHTVSATRAAGERHEWFLPESQARYLRVRCLQAVAGSCVLRDVVLHDVALMKDRNSHLQALAHEAPAGHFPRGFSGQQNYWTLVGVDGASESALMSEDGAVELRRAGPSIEPFVYTHEGKLISWANVSTKHRLQDGYLPIPSVIWQHADFSLEITAAALGNAARAQTLVQYRLTNTAPVRRKLNLVLALRPLQVNPPMQFLNTVGGVSPIAHLRWNGERLSVDGQPSVYPLTRPDGVMLLPFEAGPEFLQAQAPFGTAAESAVVEDPQRLASAAWRYTVDLAPGTSSSITLLLPLLGELLPPSDLGTHPKWVRQQLRITAERWRQTLNTVQWQLPEQAQPIAHSLRSALAHMRMSRDGVALQPGTRSYARSWIRDGAMMVEALLRTGQNELARDFVRWYARQQFSSGKVPCCVDKRGADPVPENDSHGQLIFAVSQLYRYSHDAATLRELWHHVEAALRYMEALRQSERSLTNSVGERRRYWGLMPASISHEGYSAKPMHSYWDDFWALRGYKDAVYLARMLGKRELARDWQRMADEFAHDLHSSIRLTSQIHAIDYLAGSAELGDFDPTSSTVALSPANELARLDARMVHATFERYWKFFEHRRDQDPAWEDYTPYELRTVSSMLRLGWGERALTRLAASLTDQRPRGWNQWAEVVGRDGRKPRFVGDMPHAWISSDYVRAALDLFVYENEDQQSLQVAAGVPKDWLSGPGVMVKGLRTSWGKIELQLRLNGPTLTIKSGSLQRPPGGWVMAWPEAFGPLPQVQVNGKALAWQGRVLRW